MYKKYWEFSDKPFQNTPDPKYLYRSEQHEEALARMLYVVREHMGCVVLSGVFGCGKTLLLNTLEEELAGTRYRVARLNNPQLDSSGILQSLLYRLGVKGRLPSSKAGVLNRLDRIIEDNFRDGRETIVMVDEAHVIEELEVFEELRMMLNWQKNDRPLVTLILCGQPELYDKVSNIKQLAQRVSIKASLAPFAKEDTKRYINHRLKVAGRELPAFSEQAYNEIFSASGGIPRRINSICDLSLLSGYMKGRRYVGEELVRDAAGDLI